MGKRKHKSDRSDDLGGKKRRRSASSESEASYEISQTKTVEGDGDSKSQDRDRKSHKHKKHRRKSEEDEHDRKRKKKHKKKEHKKSKKHKKRENSPDEVGPLPQTASVISQSLKEITPPIPETSSANQRVMAPMTKEQWEKERNTVRRVYDPETGRNRLVKGNGEILEEIVSKQRHQEINKQATLGDGLFYQVKAGLKNSSSSK